mmetsp:Transcript_21261/g.50547  ORF Transcript_21261/g.50547 Transcript_21261/m.50547 type:complete len:217 (-) Transcript_21261:1150-1800(-)
MDGKGVPRLDVPELLFLDSLVQLPERRRGGVVRTGFAQHQRDLLLPVPSRVLQTEFVEVLVQEPKEPSISDQFFQGGNACDELHLGQNIGQKLVPEFRVVPDPVPRAKMKLGVAERFPVHPVQLPAIQDLVVPPPEAFPRGLPGRDGPSLFRAPPVCCGTATVKGFNVVLVVVVVIVVLQGQRGRNGNVGYPQQFEELSRRVFPNPGRRHVQRRCQ